MTCRTAPRAPSAGQLDILLLDDLGYLPRGADESEVLFTLIAECYEPPPGRRARSEEETAEEQP